MSLCKQVIYHPWRMSPRSSQQSKAWILNSQFSHDKKHKCTYVARLNQFQI